METSDQSSDQQQDDNRRQNGVEDDCPSSTTDDKSNSMAENCSEGCVLKRLSNLCADCYFPRRYVVVLLLFVAMCVVHAQRVNVGVAVVSIIDSRHRTSLPIETEASNFSGLAYARHSVRTSIPVCRLYTVRQKNCTTLFLQ